MNLRRCLIAAFFLVVVAVWIALAFLERSVREEPYSQIEEHLFAGGSIAAPPPGTKAVVNLCQQKDRYQVDDHFWEPIDGSQTPSIEWMQRIVAFIDAERRQGHTVYVHCLSGMNRSGMVITAYLMYEHDWTRDVALAFARSKRAQFHPNPTLMRFLAEWEVALKQSP